MNDDPARRSIARSVSIEDARLFGAAYRAIPERPGPPRLYVVVDTEAEFDWSKPFARHLVGVSNVAAQKGGQAVLERYGVRPIYVIDYPVATQPTAIETLAAIRARGACEIGAHLHPWTNPPFTEAVSVLNSYPGNLSPEVEEEKLVNLLEAIERGFGFRPVFYKAGRYGIGPNTLALIARHGIQVDFSILPGVDLRPQGGPDLRGLRAVPYLAGDPPIISVPMSRGHTGPLAAFGPAVNRALDTRLARAVRLRGVASRLGAFRTASLTPEGVSAADLKRLATALVRGGHKTLVMHYHSPSLAPGHTPYVRTEADVASLLAGLDAVCSHVLGPLGGVAGNPSDLLSADGRAI
ncbi:MAG: polysaccharide deacetylase family protein [Acetobacteraceae bacterium]